MRVKNAVWLLFISSSSDIWRDAPCKKVHGQRPGCEHREHPACCSVKLCGCGANAVLTALLRRAFRDTEVQYHRQTYAACGGWEEFLSLTVDEDALVGYARLRGSDGGAYLRELKVFGHVVPIRGEPAREWQHRGFGTRLLEACERIAREEWGVPELFVMSGVGVREYYRTYARRRGRRARMEGPYVVL